MSLFDYSARPGYALPHRDNNVISASKLDSRFAPTYNTMMIPGPLHQTTAVAMLLSQLLLVVVGGPWLVQCQMPDGHDVIELAHVNPCDDTAPGSGTRGSDGPAPENQDSFLGDSDSIAGSFAAEDCIDTSLAQPQVLTHEDRSLSLSLAMQPILRAYQVAELPELPAPLCRVSDVSSPVFSPDSAESLARSVFLLI